MRTFFLLGWMALASSVQAQVGALGVGVDASLWASGWKNVHVAVALQEEIRFHGGVGFLSEDMAEQGISFRPRPQNFNAAFQYSLGLRLFPLSRRGQRWSELFGVELSGECFTKAIEEGFGPSGTMTWNRTDVRAIVGAECRLHRNFSVSAHLGLGRSIVHGGEAFDEGLYEATENASGMTRILGLELLFWM